MILIPFCSPFTLAPGAVLCRCDEGAWLCTGVEAHHSQDMSGSRSHHHVKFLESVLPTRLYQAWTASPIRSFTLRWHTRFGVCQLTSCVLCSADAIAQADDMTIIRSLEWVAYGYRGDYPFQYVHGVEARSLTCVP